MKIALLLSLLTLNVFAMDCDGIPEGRTFRLDKGNGSLKNAAVQDQDGVNSCFANQASLVLQSILPGNPNLSYLSMALYYTNDVSLPANRTRSNTFDARYTKRTADIANPKATSMIGSANLCKIIDNIKERQKASKVSSICRAEDVALEHSSFDTNGNSNDIGQLQEKSILQASLYMDAYQKKFGYAFDTRQRDRSRADQFRTALQNFVHSSSNIYFTKKCAQPAPEQVLSTLENALTRALNSNSYCINGTKINIEVGNCQSFAQFGILGVSSNSGNSSKVSFIQTRESREFIKAALPSLYKNKSGMSNFMSGLTNLIKKADKSKNSNANKDSFAKSIIKYISPEDMKTLQSDYNRVAMGDYEECKAANVLNFFKDKASFIDQAKKDVVLCNYPELINGVANLATVIPLPANSYNNMATFVNFITDKAGLNYDEALMPLLASDCTPDKRIALPESIQCTTVRPLLFPADFAQGAKTDGAKFIKDNRKKLMQNLQANRGIGLDICTRFWDEPSFDFINVKPDDRAHECTNGPHSYHAITAIGYRCKNNKIQYLAQNSWGPNWKPKNNAYEVEEGKIWMDEDKLFKNVDNIHYVTP